MRSVERIYQRCRFFQHLAITIPAEESGWVDCGLNPLVIGTRPVSCGWNAKVAYVESLETIESFKNRVRDIRVRFVPDPSVTLTRRAFVQKVNPSPILTPMQEIKMSNTGTSEVRFPLEAGRIEIRWAGSRQGDTGNIRPWFYTSVEADDDWFVIDGTKLDKMILVPEAEQLPTLPPLPDPE